MQKLLITACCALALGGCHAIPAPAPTVTPTTTPVSSFWPTYVRIIKGEEPDQACHPKDLHDLMLPCDQPSK